MRGTPGTCGPSGLLLLEGRGLCTNVFHHHPLSANFAFVIEVVVDDIGYWDGGVLPHVFERGDLEVREQLAGLAGVPRTSERILLGGVRPDPRGRKQGASMRTT